MNHKKFKGRQSSQNQARKRFRRYRPLEKMNIQGVLIENELGRGNRPVCGDGFRGKKERSHKLNKTLSQCSGLARLKPY